MLANYLMGNSPNKFRPTDVTPRARSTDLNSGELSLRQEARGATINLSACNANL